MYIEHFIKRNRAFNLPKKYFTNATNIVIEN